MEATLKALIQGYVEKSEKKAAVAERLLRSGDYEDAVSRAYYAVFSQRDGFPHATQALLLTEGERTHTHKGVLTLFGLLFVKTGKFDKNLGRYLANLKDDRETGDYEVFSFIDKETAETSVREAKEFLKEASSYLRELGVFES